MSGKNSLSERAGFYMAKGVDYYLTDNPGWICTFASRFGIGSRLVRYCKISVVLLLFFSVTDIHRYGAWYMGNATYIKPYWQYVIVLLWLPLLTAIFKSFFSFIADYESMLILIPVCSAVIFAVLFIGACLVCMVDEGFYITRGYFFLRGEQLYEIFTGSLTVSIALSIIIFIDILREWWYGL